MDEPHLISAARYVERNPVRAKLVARVEQWPFSSASAHVGDRADAWAEGQWLRDRIAGWVCTWGECLMGADAAELAGILRRHENTGRPLGERAFVERLSKQLGRNLLPGKAGRPRKGKIRMVSPDSVWTGRLGTADGRESRPTEHAASPGAPAENAPKRFLTPFPPFFSQSRSVVIHPQGRNASVGRVVLEPGIGLGERGRM